jgi:hypothetical protein
MLDADPLFRSPPTVEFAMTQKPDAVQTAISPVLEVSPELMSAVVAQRERGTRLISGVLSLDDNEPLAKATVEIMGQIGAEVVPFASAKTDAQGRFTAQLPGEWKGEGPKFVVKDEKGRVLHTTTALPIGVTQVESHVAIALPAGVSLARLERQRRPLRRVGAIDMDAAAVARVEPETVLDIARALVNPAISPEALRRVAALSPELLPDGLVRRTLCGTPVLEAIEELIRIRRFPRDIALEVDAILRLRDLNFGEQVYECPNFRITYQDSGPAAVDPDTSAANVYNPGTTTPIGILLAGAPPTYIKRVCFWLERALEDYTNPAFGMLNPAASGKVEVVINSSPYGSASSATNTLYLNNALSDDLLCAVAVHELFHIVQFMYGGSGLWRQSVFEGGAVFAEDAAADRLNRYLDEAGNNFNGAGVLYNTNQSLATNSYKASLFWRYLSEQLSPDISEPLIGVETYRKVIEKCSAGTYSTDNIKAAIRELPYYQDFYEFHYLDAAKLDRTSSETVFGNYALACYLKGLGTDVPDRRFEFIEDEEDIYIDSLIPGAPASSTLIAPVLSGSGTVTPSASVVLLGSVAMLGNRYYEVAVDQTVTNVSVQFSAAGGLTSSIFQIALIDEDNQVRDIHRTDHASYSKRFVNLRDGKKLSRIGIVVSGANSSGTFTVSVQSAAPAPDVMVTRWHSVAKREYEIDSRGWAWTWVSPDVWVDNDLDGVADGTVYFNYENQLHVRLHNKGNLDTSNIQVELFYQDASGGLSDAGWQPVRNIANEVQVLTGLSLSAGASNAWSVDWAPAPSGASNHFCVRAIVTVPGDPNDDNKRVLSNFGNVTIGSPFRFNDIVVLRRNIFADNRKVKLQVIPRLTPEWELSARDLFKQEEVELRPGEASEDWIRITRRQLASVLEQKREFETHATMHPSRSLTAPDPRGYYRTDPRALPPGVADKPLVTVVHLVDGVPTGGVTFMVTPDDAPQGSAASSNNRPPPQG